MKRPFYISSFARRLIAFATLVALVAGVFESLTTTYLSVENIHGLLRHMAVQGIAALGLTFVIVVRKFDMSFSGVASLGAMTLGWLIASGRSLPTSIAGALFIGLSCGLVNGVAISTLRFPDIVTTIAVGGIATGLSYFYSQGTSISEGFFDSGILDMNDSKIFSLDAPVAIMVAAALTTFVILHCSRFGRAMYATGENPISATFSGVSTRACVTFAFCVCGLMSCLAILLLVASSGASNMNAGDQLLMPAFAAVYLGAALMGTPSIPATLAGTLLTSMMLDGFTLLAVPYYYSGAVISIVLMLAIVSFDPRLAGILGHLARFPAKVEQSSRS